MLEPSEDTLARAIQVTNLSKAIGRSGVIGDAGDRWDNCPDCLVSEKGAGANMSVDVADGWVLVDGVRVQLTGGPTNLAVTAAHATLDRIDLVVWDQSAGAPIVVAGTAHATPQAPALPTDRDFVLAMITVAAAVTTIPDAVITDVRVFIPSGDKDEMPTVFDLEYDNTADNATFNNVGQDICSAAVNVKNGDRILVWMTAVWDSNGDTEATFELIETSTVKRTQQDTAYSTTEHATTLFASYVTGSTGAVTVKYKAYNNTDTDNCTIDDIQFLVQVISV